MSADADAREYLAAGFALGGLSPEEHAAAQQLADTDPSFRREVESFTETLALVAQSDEPVTPSAETEAAILNLPQRVGPQNAPQAAHPSDSAIRSTTGPRASRSSRLFALAASVLFFVALVLGGALAVQMQNQSELRHTIEAAEQEQALMEQLLSAPDLTAEHVIAEGNASVTVTYSVQAQLIHVTPHEMESPDEGADLQMWIIDEDGAHDAGLMSAEGVSIIADRSFGEGAAFGITVEPEGGSPAPTSDPIVVAALS